MTTKTSTPLGKVIGNLFGPNITQAEIDSIKNAIATFNQSLNQALSGTYVPYKKPAPIVKFMKPPTSETDLVAIISARTTMTIGADKLQIIQSKINKAFTGKEKLEKKASLRHFAALSKVKNHVRVKFTLHILKNGTMSIAGAELV